MTIALEPQPFGTAAAPTAASSERVERAERPWWREPMVWLVIGGPAVVVVAAIATAVIAMTGADPLVAKDHYRRSAEVNETLKAAPGQGGDAATPTGLNAVAEPAPALRPAMQARNHAATPVEAAPAANTGDAKPAR